MSVKIYSKSKQGNVQLAKDFQVREHASDYTDIVKVEDRLYPMMQKCKDHFNANCGCVTSGYRTNNESEKVGGYAGDQHTLGNAADFKLKRSDGSYVPASQICCYLQDLGVPGIAKITEFAVHMDFRPSGTYRGDESKGKSGITDFYAYFGIKKTSGKHIPTPTLKEGSTGQEVKALQKIIGKLTVDGVFGPETESALMKWQKKYGLTADGIYGPRTEAKMKEIY